jgi:hypothetical protein
MIIDDYVLPSVLTGYVREVPIPSVLMLKQFLPDKMIGNVEAAIDVVTRTNRAAQFRSWDAETPVGQRDSFQRSKIKLPPLGEKLPIAEQEALLLERVRSGGDNRNAYVEAIYNDAATLTGNVRRRMELARGDVLIDGKFTLTGENHLTLEADFAVPSGNIVTAGVLWSDHANAAPLQNMRTWRQAYIDLNGEPPGAMITSNTVINNLVLSGEMLSLFNRGTALHSGPDIVTPGMVQQVLSAYGLPTVTEYNTRVNVDGTNVRVIPDNLVIFLPSNAEDLGVTAWGITAESLVLGGTDPGDSPGLNGLAFEDLPGLVGVVLKEGDPVQTWTKVAAVGMPLITNPRLLMVATVL